MALGAFDAGLSNGDRLATLDVGRGRGHGLEAVVDLAAKQIIDRRAGAFVRHMQCVDAGAQLEHLQRQVLGRAAACRGKTDLAGLRLAQSNQVLHGFGRLGFVADQQVGRDADQGDGHKVALDHISELGHQAGRQRMAVDVRHEQGVAVAGLLGHIVGCDHARGAGLVFNQHGNVPHHRELLPDHTRQRIRATAGRKADHDADRAAGQVLRPEPGGCDDGRASCGGGEDGSALHGLSPLVLSCSLVCHCGADPQSMHTEAGMDSGSSPG